MRQDCPLDPGSLVWIYCRHSPGDEQDIGSQIRAAEEYCQKHGLAIARTFRDIARPGWTVVGRDGLEAMMDLARHDTTAVDGVGFWSFSRVARDIDLAQFYIAELRVLGFTVFSLTEVIPDGPEGRLFEAFIHYSNQRRISDAREDIKRGLHDRVSQGYSAGGVPPPGYLAEKKQIGWKSSGAPKYGTVWVPDPERFHLAQKAWQMRAEGAIYSEIHATIPFYKNSRCWSWFFQNKTYLGYRLCGEIEIPDAHPAACTQEQWDRVQAMKRPHRAAGDYPRRVRSPFLLSGLLECGQCGGPMSGSTSGGQKKRWRHYICSRKPNQGRNACPSRSQGAKKIDQAVIGAILDDVLTPEHIYELVEAVNEELATDQGGLDLEVANKQAELDRASKTIQNLGYAIARGSLSLTDRLLEEEKKQARLVAELELLQKRATQKRIVVGEDVILAKLHEMRTALASFAPNPEMIQLVRNFLQSFISRIVIGERGGIIYYHIPLILPRNQTETLKGLCPITSLEFNY